MTRTHPLDAVVLSLCIATIALVAFTIWHVLKQQGRIMLRLETLEALERSLLQEETSAPLRGLPIGSSAPNFSLATIDGSSESLRELDALELPVLLVFVNPNCGPCQALLPEIVRWQNEYGASLTTVLVSEGTAQENRSKALPGLKHILLQHEHEVAAAYQAFGTPAAVLIEGGFIASGVAQGAEEIRELVSEFFDGRQHVVLPSGTILPDVSVTDTAGDTVTLRDAIGLGRTGEPANESTVLLFWNPTCGFCEQMLDDLRLWEAQRQEDQPQLVFVSSLPPGDSARDLRALVVIDVAASAAAAFGARGTPMAVQIDARGAIASPVVAGREAILALLRSDRKPNSLVRAT